MGESNVGKSCLALQLAEDRYEEQGTTHGMQLRSLPPEKLRVDAAAPLGEQREVILWDLGGQDEYRLVHQLFLHDTTLALVLLDPSRGRTAFEEVRGWNLRLEKQWRGRQAVKLLVGTKCDEERTTIDQAGLQQLITDCGFAGYYPTSAKKPRGVSELGAAIAEALDWDNLSKTTRPLVFQRVREKIEERRKRNEVFVRYAELADQLRADHPQDFDPADVETVVKQLSLQGVIVDTRETSGQRVLVLQLGEIERYAGSLIVAARNNPNNVPALEEQTVTSGRMTFPGIKDRDRLPPIQEQTVLECVVQLLLEHGVCWKHAGLLIFPTLFPEVPHEAGAQLGVTVSLYYDFSGAIDNIYSSLVVQLTLSKRFGRVRLWKDRADFELPGDGVYGLRKTGTRRGTAHLDLLFSPNVPESLRAQFTVFVEDHLRNEGVTITEVLESACISCGFRFEEPLLRDRLADGFRDVVCPRCETRNPINQGAAKTKAERPGLAEDLFALKTSLRAQNQREISKTTSGFKPISVFYSYAHKDEALRDELDKHLSLLKRSDVISGWHDRKITAGADWKGEIDSRLNSASVILLLISADFLASNYCYDVEMKRALERHRNGEARVIPVLLRPVDWQGSALSELQTLPTGEKAITIWSNRDEAFVNVTQGIRTAIEDMLRPVNAPRPLVPDEAGAISNVWSPLPQPPIRILHLSDLHIAATDDPTVRLQPLVADLLDKRDGFGLERLDYLVISGDITNRASAAEFEQAYQLISQLIERFGLSAERCLIVPGNHDLNWDEPGVYNWTHRRLVDVHKLPAGSFVAQGDGYLIRDEPKYPARFTNFGKFYHSLVQQPYPTKPDEQSMSFLFPETGLQFLTLNSAWEIDEFFPHRSSINQSALAYGLLKADEQIQRAHKAGQLATDTHLFRIAVWHHPVTGNEKMVKDAFLENVRKAGIHLCLHGHVHEDRADVARYLDPKRQVYIAGAGSFGAAAKDRPESTPRLYNLIEIARDHRKIKVYTRSMRKDGGAWEGWAVWPGANAQERRAFYEVEVA